MSNTDLTLQAQLYCTYLVEALSPDCVILFGSVARGTAKPSSDIDMIVIADSLPGGWLARLRLLNHLRRSLGNIEAFGYTRAEWAHMMADKHLTVLEALHDGIPLHGKSLFAQWHAEFERWLASGLRRDAVAWTLPSPSQPEPLQPA